MPYGDQYADSKVMDYTAGHDAGFAAVCAQREMCPCDMQRLFDACKCFLDAIVACRCFNTANASSFCFLNLAQGKYWGDIMIQHAA